MKTNQMRTGILGVVVVLLLLAVVGTAYAVGERITRYNPGSAAGGGTVTNGQTTVRTAFGQPVVGVTSNANTTLCSGIACGRGVMSDDPITGLQANNDGPSVLGQPTTFSVSITGGTGIAFTWDYGDGTTGSGASPIHTYAAVGTYTATVTASNGAGTQTAETTVEVSHAVVEVRNFEFVPNEVTIPVGGRVTWVRIEGNHNVKADDGSFTSGPPSSTWTSYTQQFDQQGDFPYYCELHGGPGGVGMSGVVHVTTSIDAPIAGLTATNDGPTLLGNPTQLTASITAGSNVDYTWDYGDGTSGAGPAPQHTYAQAGTYVATVTAFNSTGSASASTTVEVSHAVVEVTNFAFSPTPVIIKPGQRVTWVRREGNHNVVADDDSFTSGPPSSAWSTFTQTFNDVGTNPYYCVLHGAPGGVGMAGVVIVESGTDTPIIGLTAANDGPTVRGQPTSLTATISSGSNVSYSWDYGDGTTGTGPNPQHIYAVSGDYAAMVTASNDTGSTTATTTVNVSDAVVEVRNFEFGPEVVLIPQGGRVTWVRSEGNHNVKADDGSFTSGPPTSTWTSYTRDFASEGDYPYYCELHGGPNGVGMAGVIQVRKQAKTFLPIVVRTESGER